MKQNSNEFLLRVSEPRTDTPREFFGGRHFRIAHRVISDSLMRPITSRMVDLLNIAASVYFMDRLTIRDRKHGPEGWPRTISFSLEVREPEFWASAPVCEIFHETLNFVSGDRWKVEFRSLPGREPESLEWQRPIHPNFLGETQRVCLYSGGLDSAAGLAKQMSGSPKSMTLPVTVQHRTDLGSTVKEQLHLLTRCTRADYIPVIVPFEMDAPKSLVQHEEKSQRTRAFLFVATGGIVAAAAGATELEMYESGVGAVNVPLLAGMEGTQATRGAHPRFLELMSKLIQKVLGNSVDVHLPFAQLTKGDVVKSLNCDALTELAKSTISCAHFPIRLQKGDKWRSCGLCPACIFRRLALHAAGIDEEADNYQHDFLNPQVSQLNPKKLRYLTAYLLQVDSLRDLDSGKLPLNINRHLRWTNLLRPGESQQMYVDLFRRYRSEWYGLLELAHRNGCTLAKRIDVSEHAAG